MAGFFDWINKKNNREIASFVVAPIVVLVGAAWAVYIHFDKNPAKPSQATQANTSTNTNTNTNINNNNVTVNVPASAPSPTMAIAAEYKICKGTYQRNCPPDANFFYCNSDIEAWIAERCARYDKALISAMAGNACGYEIAVVKCYVAK
jgi:hypothetical protein